MATTCHSPYMVIDEISKRELGVPCGKCPACKKRRASAWSFRLMQEEKVSSSAMFLTITYNTEHVPISPKGFMTLNKTDIRAFMKALRKRSIEKLKYYYCGEYGGLKMRPHYHMLLFNALIQDVEKSWQKGEIHYGSVTGASVGYTLKYMMKEPKIPMHENDDRMKEFSNMSKGLGKSYINEKTVAWHKANICERVYITIEDGKKICMPRYIKEKLYTSDEKEIIKSFNELKSNERKIEYQEKLIKAHGDNWEDIERQWKSLEISKMHSNAEKNRFVN